MFEQQQLAALQFKCLELKQAPITESIQTIVAHFAATDASLECAHAILAFLLIRLN